MRGLNSHVVIGNQLTVELLPCKEGEQEISIRIQFEMDQITRTAIDIVLSDETDYSRFMWYIWTWQVKKLISHAEVQAVDNACIVNVFIDNGMHCDGTEKKEIDVYGPAQEYAFKVASRYENLAYRYSIRSFFADTMNHGETMINQFMQWKNVDHSCPSAMFKFTFIAEDRERRCPAIISPQARFYFNFTKATMYLVKNVCC